MRKIIACTLMVFSVFVAFGRNTADSVKVYFSINNGRFDPSLGDNASSMNAFIDRIRMAVDARDLDHITISAFASPDGPLNFNNRLSVKRCDAIAFYIMGKTGIGREMIHTNPEGVAWSELRQLVAGSSDVPTRAQVLDILDNTPPLTVYSSGRVKRTVDIRKKRLMELDNGVTYRWMLDHLFPKLRNALAISIYHKSDSCNRLATMGTTDSLKAADVAGSVLPVTLDVSERFADGGQSVFDIVLPPASADAGTVASTPARYILALKTNMLYYGALMPNAELEWLINDRWSVALEGDLAWWGDYSCDKSYRIAVISSEVRRWIKPRVPWHGMYVGLFAGGGLYDLMNGSPGYYGEGVMTGASFGYIWPIGKRLSLEAGIGAGYMYTRVKEYKPYENDYLIVVHLVYKTVLFGYAA